MNSVERLISLLGPGGAAKLARACGVKPQNITRWIRTSRIPAHHCLQVEALTGVKASVLRPDVFMPTPPADLAKAS